MQFACLSIGKIRFRIERDAEVDWLRVNKIVLLRKFFNFVGIVLLPVLKSHEFADPNIVVMQDVVTQICHLTPTACGT